MRPMPPSRVPTGKVNGLQRPTRVPGAGLRVRRRAPVTLVVAGGSLYVVALLFPVLLRQVSGPIVLAAVLGTVLLLAGLHVRWTRGDSLAS